MTATQLDSICNLRSYRMLRYNEDWSFLKNAPCRNGFWDGIKYIPLSQNGNRYLSFGGDVRLAYEWFKNPDFGDSPPDDNGYTLQRYRIHSDLHFGKSLRLFAQLKSGIELGRAGGPRPIDENYLDIHQGFVDGVVANNSRFGMTLRVGRQEMTYGSSRLVALREGPNIQTSYDGIRNLLRFGKSTVDVFASKPVETNKGIFDDGWEKGQWFWGAFGTGIVKGEGEKPSVDLYYLGVYHRNRTFDQGTANETRHTGGARLYGQKTHLVYDVEAMGQVGTFGAGAIRAWRIATETSYILNLKKPAWRLGLKADIASGDKDPNDPNLQTFNSLYQSGTYSGRAGILGSANAMQLEPMVHGATGKKMTFLAGWGFFWRQSVFDGVYTIPSTPLRTGKLSRARYLGSRVTIEPHWQINKQLSFDANYIRVFTAERFARETPPGGPDVDFVTFILNYSF